MMILRAALCCLFALASAWAADPAPGAKPPQFPAPGADAAPAPTAALVTPPNTLKTVQAESMGAGTDAGGSPPFGGRLFNNRFAAESFTGFNPNYRVAIGDRVEVRLWGGFDFQGIAPVDDQGNLFLPKVGPIAVGGVRNQELNQVVDTAVRAVFERNVHVYASLAGAQPVKIYVSGQVASPGLYPGNAADSVIAFLDRAGGILPRQGSYLGISVLRDGKPHATIDLYRFLTTGEMPPLQFHDGDVVLIAPRGPIAEVRGLVQNANAFEFAGASIPLPELLSLARPLPEATHLRITRQGGGDAMRTVDYLPISGTRGSSAAPGDVIEAVSDRRDGMISVRVEGEHESAREYIVPFGARLGVILAQLRFNERSDPAAISLQRVSVRERQRERLAMQLKALEAAVLNARSNTAEEAGLRTREAELALQWIERARAVEPKGQVVLAGNPAAADMTLESGDILVVPRKDPLIMVNGEVLFPTTVLWREGLEVGDYLDQAGGLGPNADAEQIVILHRDGSFIRVLATRQERVQRGWNSAKSPASYRGGDLALKPGDEILVLPKVDVKTIQITKDVTQVLYQIAISAAVVLAL